MAWFCFSDVEAIPYYFNFQSGSMQYYFPQLTVRVGGTSCSLLRPCSTMSRTVISHRAALTTFCAAKEYIRVQLASGVTTPGILEASSFPLRAQQLWQRPTQLSELLMMAQVHGPTFVDGERRQRADRSGARRDAMIELPLRHSPLMHPHQTAPHRTPHSTWASTR